MPTAKLALAALEADVILIEGVMGLYRRHTVVGRPGARVRGAGAGGDRRLGNGANRRRGGAGLRDYGPVEVAGVIANRVGSAAHAEMVATSLRGVPLLATLPRQPQALPERHLGLLPPDEVIDIDAVLDALAAQLLLDEPAGRRWRRSAAGRAAAPPAPCCRARRSQWRATPRLPSCTRPTSTACVNSAPR